MRKLRFLIASLTYPLPNGVTRSIDKSIDGLIAKGHQVVAIGPEYNNITNHRPEHLAVPSSIMTQAVCFLFKREERSFSPTAYSDIGKIAKEFNPDIYWLHTLSFFPNAFETYMLEQAEGIKVLSYHTVMEEYGRRFGWVVGAQVIKSRSKWVGGKMDAIIVPSKMMKDRLLFRYRIRKPVQIIPTGITEIDNYFSKQELCQKFNIPWQAKILLYVGRVCKEKNVEVLLEAMKSIREKQKNAYLLVIGPGEIDKFRKIAQRIGVADKVIFAGSFPPEETQKMYTGADVFVFASPAETQALVIGEAMMAELPVVAFELPIQPEVYPDNLCFVVRNKDQFVSAVLNVLRGSEEIRTMAKKAKEFVKNNFSTKAMIEKQEALFLQLCKKK